jgi:hypothetical protein
MDEYISKKEAIIAVTHDGCTANVVGVLYHLPPADVAPRAEVDKAKLNGYELGKREVARCILQEVRNALLNMVLSNAIGENFDIEKVFAEIEKKYTGG